MEIRVSELESMIEIVTRLTKAGYGFSVKEDGAYWLITLTGSF